MNRRAFMKFVTAGGASLALPRRLAWAADTDNGADVRFVFYTDIHTRTEWQTPDALERAADLINKEKVDLVISGGDLITDGYDSTPEMVEPRWSAYFDHLHNRIRAPVHAAIGNHDLIGVEPKDGSPAAADPKAIFRQKLGLDRTFRSLDAQGLHIIFLDPLEVSHDTLKYRGVIDPAQLEWLKADLAAVDAGTPVVVVCHMPLMTGFYQMTEGSMAAAPPNRVVSNGHDVLDALADHNLILVLQGHLHVNEFYRWRNATFITGGAVCGKWWRGPWQGTEEGFGVVTVRKGRVEWEYVDLGWEAKRPAGV